MTTLILVRHGQSVANEQWRFAGHSDFALSKLGKRQAQLAGQYIHKNFNVDKIYSSDLKRAYCTALPASELFGIPVIKRKGLREIFAGVWETMTFDEIAEEYPEAFHTWKFDFSNARCTDGESVFELYDRFCAEILSIAEENEGKCVLIATHAAAIRTFEAMCRGLGREHVGDIGFVANASINLFGVDNGVPYVIQTSITDHLADEINQ